MNFKELNIKEELKESIVKKGFEEMTAIQEESIPLALEGKDILGQAQTGTGKTAAFAIPIINNLDFESKELQSLVLVPTRELAIQVNKEILSLGKDLKVNSIAVYGGDPIDKQMQLLKNRPQIVVGTPGRCIDLINRKKLKIHNIKMFCLDEVDEMLNMGFIDDVEFISQAMPKDKQTLLFSATMPEKIKRIANKYQNNPKVIKVKSKSLVADRVDQSYTIVKQKQKMLVLKNLIDLNKNDKIIIFTQTKRSTDEISDFLLTYGLKIGKIHGDLPQKTRTTTIQKFRDNQIQYLVATDVVARGIDIDNISLVINYELPQDIEYYIHRIGRTARGTSAKGRAITLVSPNVYDKEFRHYGKKLDVVIKEAKRPELKDVINILKGQVKEEILTNTQEVEEVYKELTKDIVGEKDPVDIIPILLSQLYPQLSRKENLKAVGLDNEDLSNGKRNKRGNNGSRGGNRDRNSRGGNRDRNSRGGNRDRNSRDGNRDRNSRDGKKKFYENSGAKRTKKY